MVICRTPLRISFFGGGTDYPIWYREHGGAVLSATINKYSYITVRWLPPYFNYKHRIRYYQQEEVSSLDEIRHPSVRECARYLNIQSGIEVVHNADVPAQSGLGSSSSFTVGMLHALYTLQHIMPTKRQLAVEAIYVEQDLIGETVGSQDQTAAAFGGLNHIIFNKSGEFEVQPIVLSSERQDQLNGNLFLVYTGLSRNASVVASLQVASTHLRMQELKSLQELCDHALKILARNETSLDDFGRLLGEHWRIKRRLTDLITNREIDLLYQRGIESGALGGKLLGAGSGGFLLFYVPERSHSVFKENLSSELIIPFRFESTGSAVVYFSN